MDLLDCSGFALGLCIFAACIFWSTGICLCCRVAGLFSAVAGFSLVSALGISTETERARRRGSSQLSVCAVFSYRLEQWNLEGGGVPHWVVGAKTVWNGYLRWH